MRLLLPVLDLVAWSFAWALGRALASSFGGSQTIHSMSLSLKSSMARQRLNDSTKNEPGVKALALCVVPCESVNLNRLAWERAGNAYMT